jgi:peptidoglycan/xylan/chitin deacetylase (PgdA/CDA1 family)
VSAIRRACLRSLPPGAVPFVVLGLLLVVLVVSASVANAVRPSHEPAPAQPRFPSALDGVGTPAWAATPSPGTRSARPSHGTPGPVARHTTPAPGRSADPDRDDDSAVAGQHRSPRGGRPGHSHTSTPARRSSTPDPAAIITHTAHRVGTWVALTFDDGPTPAYTPQVLGLLRDYHVKATFCMVGLQAREFPSLVREVYAQGHRLCNHTMTHDEHLPDKSTAAVRSEMRQADAAIHAAVPEAPITYYRAPGGFWSPKVRRTAWSMHMRSLGWSVDTEDWRRPGTSVILANIRKELTPGGVVLMHDGGGDRSQTLAALRRLLANLTHAGYRFDFPG